MRATVTPAITALRLFLRAVEASWGDETPEEIARDCITALERGGIPELRRCVEENERESEGDDE